MTQIEAKTPKGFRDFLPAEAASRFFVLEILRKTLAKFGFEPLETPAIEYAETLKGKYGEEEKLIYEFEDRGGRQIALRYDQTVPLARVVAQYKNIPKPFKRYQIQPVWRAENPQKGRFREFLQIDFDTVGTKSILADSETILVVIECLKAIGFKNFTVKVNDRSVFQDLPPTAITSIDKLKKLGDNGVFLELQNKGFSPGEARRILDKIKQDVPTTVVEEIFKNLEYFGVSKDLFCFDPTLARGLDYYTGSIFEVDIEGYTAGSIGGGGRYDDLIGVFANEKIPAVGFSFGFDRLVEAAKEANLLDGQKSTTKVLVTIFNEELAKDSLALTTKLRNSGVNAEVYLDPETKLDKQLKYADNKQIPYVLIIGPEELEKGTITLKDLESGEQEQLKQTELIKKLQSIP